MSEKLTLSICMIVKDEEKNLRRCLDSLQPLLDKEDAELIIVDTGSTDKTVQIAKEYTPYVYFHEWNHNFSDMRNKSISYAKGKWILIIDADEELENPENLILLLNSEEIQKYNTVRFTVKNLLLRQTQYLSYLLSERLFRNNGEFRYVGSIHNQPLFQEPVLTSEIELMHYGYINEDKELMEKKFQRTATMLKKELENSPNNIYYRFQLARSYLMHNDIYEALVEIRKAYSTLKKQNKKMWLIYYGVFVEYARISCFANKYEETIKICEEGIQLMPEYIDFYYYLGRTCFIVGEKEKGFKALESYFKLYEKYNTGDLDCSQYNKVELYSNDEKTKKETAYKIAYYLYEKENYAEALKYIELIDESPEKIKLLTKIRLDMNDCKNLRKYYVSIQNEQLKLFFINNLENEKKQLSSDKQADILEEFSLGEDEYAQLQNIRLANNEDKKVIIKDFLSSKNINELPVTPYYEVFKYMIEVGMSPFPVWKKLKTFKLKRFVKHLIDDFCEIKEFFIDYLEKEKVRVNDFQGNRVYSAIASVILLNEVEVSKKNNLNLDKRYHSIFSLYVERGINYTGYLYSLERIRIIYETIDDFEHQFLILLYFVKEAIEKGNINNAVRYYKEAVNVYPYFAELMKEYRSRLFISME